MQNLDAVRAKPRTQQEKRNIQQTGDEVQLSRVSILLKFRKSLKACLEG
jgi:hypothetical protein